MLSSEEVEVALANCLSRVIEPKGSGQRLVDTGKTAGAILEVNMVRKVIHQGTETFVPLGQFFHQLRQLGRVFVLGDPRGFQVRGIKFEFFFRLPALRDIEVKTISTRN